MTRAHYGWAFFVFIIVFLITYLFFLGSVSSFNLRIWMTIIFLSLTVAVVFVLVEHFGGFLFTEKMGALLNGLKRMSAVDILVGLGGLIIGLVVGVLVSYPMSFWHIRNPSIPMVITLVSGALGFSVFMARREDIVALFTGVPKMKLLRGQKGGNKILDTSAIVDGRIADICKTGFVEGDMIVPRFVLKELQQVADSQDPLKRSRGRRGLDILNKMRKEKKVAIRIIDRDFADIRDVDAKLIKLGMLLGAKVITNDFNLNKIAELEGVEVLNINDLANALKPYVLPGEELRIQIIREGKESDQGVGYLDDGTMVVVEGGKRHINNTIDTVVTSVLQTPAGRMIFARPRGKHISG